MPAAARPQEQRHRLFFPVALRQLWSFLYIGIEGPPCRIVEWDLVEDAALAITDGQHAATLVDDDVAQTQRDQLADADAGVAQQLEDRDVARCAEAFGGMQQPAVVVLAETLRAVPARLDRGDPVDGRVLSFNRSCSDAQLAKRRMADNLRLTVAGLACFDVRR